jgi:hypothetical protein
VEQVQQAQRSGVAFENPLQVLPLMPFDEALRPRPVRVSGLASSVGYSGKLHLDSKPSSAGQKRLRYLLLRCSSLIAEMRGVAEWISDHVSHD